MVKVATSEEKALASALQAIEDNVEFARTDMGDKDWRRVASDLRSIAMASLQAEQQLIAMTMREAGGVPAVLELPNLAAEAPEAPAPRPRQRRTNTASENNGFREAVIDILRRKGEPMKLDELREELKKRGIADPGKGKAANFTVRLKRMPEIHRPKYGHYALKEGV